MSIERVESRGDPKFPAAPAEAASRGPGIVKLFGQRILVEVRPVSRSEKVPHGVLLTDTLLMGKVQLVAPGVPEDIRPGDEIWFRRPMNEIPAFAMLPYTDVELLRRQNERVGEAGM